jgi:hypothetical protein
MLVSIKVSEVAFKRLSKLAIQKNASHERLINLSFLLGLRVIEKTENPGTSERVEKGASNKVIWRTENKVSRADYFKILDELIKQHWNEKSDLEIGNMMDPKASEAVVAHRRRINLGIRRPKNGLKVSSLRSQINREEFETMVCHEGYTMVDYIKAKGFKCSRQRIEQIARMLGLKHSPEDRTPMWEILRRARLLGNLKLAEKEWLQEKVNGADSVQALAAELKIGDHDLFFFIRKLQISDERFRKHGVVTVELTCSYDKCAKKFSRFKRHVDKAIKEAKGSPVKFYCTVRCAGLDNGKARIERMLFISENYKSMTDQEIAEKLGIPARTVENLRLEMGALRRKPN